MKYCVALFSIVASGLAAPLAAETTYHAGIGVGSQYAGTGLNFTRVTDNDLLALGAGLVNQHTAGGSEFGVAISYHRSDIIGDSGRHALGVGYGAIDYELRYRANWSGSRWHYTDVEHNAVYGGMLMYNYYQRRMELGGPHIGVSYDWGSGDFRNTSRISINFGYRF